MGSYTELIVDDYPILSSKSYLISEIRMIFLESDREEFKRKISNRNLLVWGKIKDDSEETIYEYKTTRSIAIERLEKRGYTLSKTKQNFEKIKKELIQEYDDTLLELYTFDDFINAFISLRQKKICDIEFINNQKISDLERYLLEDNACFWYHKGYPLKFPHNHMGFYLRAYLESFNEDISLIQDVSEVINAGYYKETDKIIRDLLYKYDGEPLIITEGKTDWKHLKKALERFQEQDIYIDLNIEFQEYEKEDMGDSELATIIRIYSKAKQTKRHIMIFDRDQIGKNGRKDVKKLFNKDEAFKEQGNNVYSMFIPKIDEKLDEICIEFFYKQEEVKSAWYKGKRLFYGNEFNKETSKSLCGKYKTDKPYPKALDILDGDNKKKVYYIDDDEKKENNIALSKNDFTNNIINDVEGFDDFDIENFKLIFDVIEKIVHD